MNDAVQAKLREIVINYGMSVIDDPLRCQGLLNDLCPTSRREVTSLILTLRDGVAIELIKAGKNTPRQALTTRLIRQVTSNIGLSEDVARWAVESWARAVDALPPGVRARQQTPVATPTKPISPIKPTRPGRLAQGRKTPSVAVTKPAKPAVNHTIRTRAISDTIQHPSVLISMAVVIVSGLYLIFLSRLYGGILLSTLIMSISAVVALGSFFSIYPRMLRRGGPPQNPAQPAAPQNPKHVP
jgi:hypothetical protein